MAHNAKGERAKVELGQDRGNGKPIVDSGVYFKSTDSPLRDKLYNWVVKRHTRNGRPWRLSDTVVWYGAIYELSGWIMYPVAIAFFWFLAELAMKVRGKGDPLYGVMLLLVLLLVRFGRTATTQRQIKQQLEKLNKKL